MYFVVKSKWALELIDVLVFKVINIWSINSGWTNKIRRVFWACFKSMALNQSLKIVAELRQKKE